MHPVIYCFLLSSLVERSIWPNGFCYYSLSLSTRKNTIQVFMGVSLISIFVAVDVKMFFLRYQHNFLAKTF